MLEGTTWPWEEEKTSEKMLVSGSNEELVFLGNNEKFKLKYPVPEVAVERETKE